MKAIGVDIGTTTLCGVIVNLETGIIEKTLTVANNTVVTLAHSWERVQDAEQITRACDDLLKELYEKDCAVLGFTGQMHGIVYLDCGGNPVSPLYTWQDGRGNLPYEGQTVASFLGVPSGFGIVTDFYLETNGLLPKDAVVFCTIADYLAAHYTQKNQPLVHASNAAGLGLYDSIKNEFTVSNPRLPAVTAAVTRLGTWNELPVCTAIGDNQASFAGSGADEHSLLINVGTGSQISFLSKNPSSLPLLETRPFDGESFLCVGAALCGGRSYALLEQFFEQIVAMAGFTPADLYEKMNDLAANVVGNPLIADTRFCGTRQNSDLRGSIRNIGPDNFTPAQMTVAVLRGMGEELFNMIGSVPSGIDRLIASGNGIRKNSALRKIIENIFGLKMNIPKQQEEAALGAAFFAAADCGIFSSVADSRCLVQFNL